eukprot:CAMPEP_0197038920 /NCGR_PEP_ID=MMETSP1384-20130603/15790_1 /TAXON_ID=29189 /ORGANISM="Ammonia sp." /LENGTH=670 /DNA_ID=CAMNT_0042469427 /DNA_START=36 /DNA_END=2048 /DNA_ORIENTATION=-
MAHRDPIGINTLTAAILFAPLPARSATFTRYASNGEFDCGTAGKQDSCQFFCDTTKSSGRTFDCGNAGECDVQCTSFECLFEATVNASNSNNLNAVAAAKECFSNSIVYVPDAGNATLSVTQPLGLMNMDVIAGRNTQNIILDCVEPSTDINECKNMDLHAETAQYVEIRSGANAGLTGTSSTFDVWCPVNSSYTGPERAPCILDLSTGGSMDEVNIHTANGIPRDVWISATAANSLNKVKISCIDTPTLTVLTYPFDSTDVCWSPTSSPTTDPTGSPTISSTGNPTRPPTAAPSGSTASPSVNPSQNPSAQPSTSQPTTSSPSSANPTTSQPSASPSKFPTANPSLSPTVPPTLEPTVNTPAPTALPTALPTMEMSTTDEDTDTDTPGEQAQIGGLLQDRTLSLILICNLLLFCTCLVIGWCVWRKYRKYRKQQQIVDTMLGSRSASSPMSTSNVRVTVEEEKSKAKKKSKNKNKSKRAGSTVTVKVDTTTPTPFGLDRPPPRTGIQLAVQTTNSSTNHIRVMSQHADDRDDGDGDEEHNDNENEKENEPVNIKVSVASTNEGKHRPMERLQSNSQIDVDAAAQASGDGAVEGKHVSSLERDQRAITDRNLPDTIPDGAPPVVVSGRGTVSAFGHEPPAPQQQTDSDSESDEEDEDLWQQDQVQATTGY